MIDEEWLARQRFTMPHGSRSVGLLGVGSENVVFETIAPDGTRTATKMRRDHLGWHIRELPLFTTGEPAYDLDRLARKLAALRGDPALDAMSHDYNRLNCAVVRVLHDHGVVGVLAQGLRMLTPDFVIFLLKSPGIRRRLSEFAALPDQADHDGYKSPYLTVNGNFPINTTRSALKRWAAETLPEIDSLSLFEQDLRPETLPDNPLYVWGAAVTDGFVTDEEMDRAAAYVDRPGTVPDEVTMLRLDQAHALAHLLQTFLQYSEAERFARFCSRAGYMFPLADGKYVS